MVILLLFAIAWTIAVVVGRAVWKKGKDWSRFTRMLAASFTGALFATPSILVGHGAAPVPLLLQLVAQPNITKEILGIIVVAFAVTWLLIFLVLFTVSTID